MRPVEGLDLIMSPLLRVYGVGGGFQGAVPGLEFGFRCADLLEQVAGFDIAQEDLQGEGGDAGDFPEQRVLLVGQWGEGSNFQHCEDSLPRQKGKNDNGLRGGLNRFRDDVDVVGGNVGELQGKVIESNSLMVVLVDRSGGQVLGVVTLHDVLRAEAAMAEAGADSNGA